MCKHEQWRCYQRKTADFHAVAGQARQRRPEKWADSGGLIPQLRCTLPNQLASEREALPTIQTPQCSADLIQPAVGLGLHTCMATISICATVSVFH
jgi:hypothetical protein